MKNREILFRGKRVDGKGWVQGHYTQGSDEFHYITNQDGSVWQIDPETVGQFTGLRDKKGNKIFEGDILTSNSQNDIIAGFYNGCFISNNTYITLHTEIKDLISRKIVFEITSNIHDNPKT